ncbi:MAG: hypothetical protein II174_03290, partial [Erysipelotrichaceae bacterium]|nr:hypothetical protein [Erysipelotrichaceae bacterium]
GEDIMAEFDKLKESDAYKKTADFLSDISAKVNDYFNKPEVKEVINKAKTTTIKVAEKGVENLKKALEPKEEAPEAPAAPEAPVESPVEEEPKE